MRSQPSRTHPTLCKPGSSLAHLEYSSNSIRHGKEYRLLALLELRETGERNKVMKVLDMKGSTLIEDPAPFTVEISRYQKYGEVLKNSVDSFLLSQKLN